LIAWKAHLGERLFVGQRIGLSIRVGAVALDPFDAVRGRQDGIDESVGGVRRVARRTMVVAL
jgi:hypothetical protein